jgi:hypothetical protein
LILFKEVEEQYVYDLSVYGPNTHLRCAWKKKLKKVTISYSYLIEGTNPVFTTLQVHISNSSDDNI